MLPIFNRHVYSSASAAEAAANTSALQSGPVETSAESGASNDERPATYEELMPYLMLAMVAGI